MRADVIGIAHKIVFRPGFGRAHEQAFVKLRIVRCSCNATEYALRLACAQHRRNRHFET